VTSRLRRSPWLRIAAVSLVGGVGLSLLACYLGLGVGPDGVSLGVERQTRWGILNEEPWGRTVGWIQMADTSIEEVSCECSLLDDHAVAPVLEEWRLAVIDGRPYQIALYDRVYRGWPFLCLRLYENAAGRFGSFGDPPAEMAREYPEYAVDSVLWAPLGANIAVYGLSILCVCTGVKLSRTAFRAAVRTKRRRRGACPNCGYPLRGLPSRRCPECGGVAEAAGYVSMRGDQTSMAPESQPPRGSETVTGRDDPPSDHNTTGSRVKR